MSIPKTPRRTLEVRSTRTSAVLFTLSAPGHYLVSHDDPIVVTQIAETEAVVVVRRHPTAYCHVRTAWPMAILPLADNAVSISMKREVRQ
jgi:hypothetical protein